MKKRKCNEEENQSKKCKISNIVEDEQTFKGHNQQINKERSFCDFLAEEISSLDSFDALRLKKDITDALYYMKEDKRRRSETERESKKQLNKDNLQDSGINHSYDADV